MKKMTAAVAIMLFSFSTFSEAKRGGGMRVVKTKPATQQAQAKPQQDADFHNTPAQPAQAAANGNRASNFLTGAAAGYLLSDMLSPTEAQAQTQTATQPAEKSTESKGEQAVNSAPQSAHQSAHQTATPAAVPTVQAFKMIDPQDPNLIERTAGYSRYCLNGVQYLLSASNNQLPPTLMVDKNNAPVQCVITP